MGSMTKILTSLAAITIVAAMALHYKPRRHLQVQDYGIDWSTVLVWTNYRGCIVPGAIETKDGVVHWFSGTNWQP